MGVDRDENIHKTSIQTEAQPGTNTHMGPLLHLADCNMNKILKNLLSW